MDYSNPNLTSISLTIKDFTINTSHTFNDGCYLYFKGQDQDLSLTLYNLTMNNVTSSYLSNNIFGEDYAGADGGGFIKIYCNYLNATITNLVVE